MIGRVLGRFATYLRRNRFSWLATVAWFLVVRFWPRLHDGPLLLVVAIGVIWLWLATVADRRWSQ